MASTPTPAVSSAPPAHKPLRGTHCQSPSLEQTPAPERRLEGLRLRTASDPETQAVPAGRSVLIVDDEELVSTMLDLMLRRFGCTVRIARNGAEAIDRFRGDETIGLVLLDVRMPGLDGPETLHILQTIKPQVPCCFMTGDVGKYTETDLLSRGVVSILKKPFRLQEIAQVLRQVGIPTDQ